MKVYDRKQRKWVEQSEVDKKLSKRKLCKGGKPHDFTLILPWYVKHKDSALGIEISEKYYAIELEIDELILKKKQELEKIGIISSNSNEYSRKQVRCYVCTVCGKEETDL